MSLHPRLRLRHLSTFLAVARTGSVGQAAAELHITQPAVSKTLRELEDILGARLLDRTGRRVVLNAAGTEFQRVAGGAVAALTKAQDTVRGVARQRRLRVGSLPTAATRLLPAAALRFRQQHPHCALRVSTGPNWLLLNQLREGALDLVVGRMADPERMEALNFRHLYVEPVVPVARAEHPQRDPLDAEAVRRHPLILPPPGAVIHQTVRAWLVGVGAADVQPAFESVSAAFCREVLLHSDAVWFISRGVITDLLDRGELQELEPSRPLMPGPVGISLRTGQAPDEDLGALVAALEEVARETR